MGNPNHHLAIHGHFYQPPRENPWLGAIEPQPSAGAHPGLKLHTRPLDWNERIAAECYAPLARSPLRNGEGRIADLYNNYAYLSFNVGPTLFAWIEQHRPALLRNILVGDRLSAARLGGHGGALAQSWSHTILPLSDARDRHTQIVWGLAEFRHRFGRDAEGMWLPEAAIDHNTVRALIDHGVRYLILAPQQAGWVRPFGQENWREVTGGRVDPRMPYRLFEVDGGGRTHFDRYLDVVFYHRGLNLKSSFEHLMADADRFRHEARNCFDPDASLPQLVLLATDGELYGHHEPRGEATLAQVFARTAPDEQLYLTNVGHYLADHPPVWEVRLWMGEDGRGSSWSCDHGIGRWERDCGCSDGAPAEWNQAWRAPLRRAFDRLYAVVREVYVREAGGLLRDPWEARDDYVRILLAPDDPELRAAFLDRHAAGALSGAEADTVWRLLEAARYGMTMYTSCGWFFGDLAGLEPIQNMRYACRAAELVQPFVTTDLTALLERELGEARSNLPEAGSGAEVFRREVLPTRYTPREIGAAAALTRLLGLPAPRTDWIIRCSETGRSGPRARFRAAWGRLTLQARRTRERFTFDYLAVAASPESAGVFLADPAADERLPEAKALRPGDLGDALREKGVPLSRLPRRERALSLAELVEGEQEALRAELVELASRGSALLELLAENDLPPPASLRAVAEQTLAERLRDAAQVVADGGRITPRDRAEAEEVLATARRIHVGLDRIPARTVLAEGALWRLNAAAVQGEVRRLEGVLAIVSFAESIGVELGAVPVIVERFWDCLDAYAPGGALAPLPEEQRETLRGIGRRLGFSPTALARVGTG